MSGRSSNARAIIRELVDNIRSIFKKYSITARRAAWDGLLRGDGKKLIDDLIISPSRPITGVERLYRHGKD